MLKRNVIQLSKSLCVVIPKQICTMHSIDKNTVMKVTSTRKGICFTPILNPEGED